MRGMGRFTALVVAGLFVGTLVGGLWGGTLCWLIAAECGVFPAVTGGAFGILGLIGAMIAALEAW